MTAQPRTDLIGQTFGAWKVTAFSHRDEGGTFWWFATCTPGVCDAERVQRGWVLTSGKSTRCGACAHAGLAELKSQEQADRWVGTETGGWVITARSGSVQYGRHKISMWTCRCLACGAVVDIPSRDIHKPIMPVCRHGGAAQPIS